MRYGALQKDTFYRNSIFIILSSITASSLGLLFWMVAAQYYSIDNVGIAATILSTAGLIASLAGLGMDQSMIRFFPIYDKSRIFGTTLKMTVIITIIMGIGFIAGSSIWMPDLVASEDYSLLFMILICAMNVAYIAHTAFVSARVAQYGWAQNLILGSRVLLLVPLVALQSLGILDAIIISYALALTISSLFLFRSGIRLGRIDWGFLKESLWFSTGNYIANFLSNLPSLALPLIVFSLIGSNEAAIYYMALSISMIVFIIPTAFTTSLFVEGSHGKGLVSIVKKSVIVSYIILVPLVLIFVFMGQWILGLLGQEYVSQGLGILRLMIISSLFLTLCLVESTVLKIRGHVKGVIALGAVNSLSFFALSYIFFILYGTDGIGYAWIISYAISALIGLFIIWAVRGRIGDNPSISDPIS